MADSNRIPVLEKTIEVVEYIATHPGAVSRTELQKALGIPQATCYRIVATLAERGWLEAFRGNRYDLAWHLCRMVQKKRFDPWSHRKFQPLLSRLAERIRYPVKLSIRDGEEFLNVCFAQASWDDSLFSEPGTRSPVDFTTSVGTVFSAESGETGETPDAQQRLADYQRDGYSFNPGTMDPAARFHVDTLSYPIRRTDGELLAVLSVLSIPGMLVRADWDAIGTEVRDTIERILNLF